MAPRPSPPGSKPSREDRMQPPYSPMTRPAVSVVMHGARDVVPEGADEAIEVAAKPSFAELNRSAADASREWILFLDAGASWPGAELDRHLDQLEAAAPGAIEIGKLRLEGTGGLLVQARAFHSAGGFFEDIRAGAAADLVGRLSSSGWEVRRAEGETGRVSGLAAAFHNGAAALWLSRRHGGARIPEQAGLAARLGAALGTNRVGKPQA